MDDQPLSSSDIGKIIAPGDVLVVSCPSGTSPNLRAGDFIPNADDPQFFVVASGASDFTIGPIKSGTFNLAYKCSNQEFQTSIEVPAQDPSKVPPREGPLGPLAYNIPWLWIIIAALALLATAVGTVWNYKKKRSINDTKKGLSKQSNKKDPTQLLKEMIITLENIEKTPSSPEIKSDELYQRGYRSVRGFLESELKLKTQAETTPQFLGSLRMIAPAKQISAELLSRIERSMNFSDQNRFGAALSDSPDSRKNYAAELRGILQSLLKADVVWRAETASIKPKGRTK